MLILTDIFGHTQAVDALAQDIGGAEILSPYTCGSAFTNEQDAYQFFSQRVGINGYLERLQGQLANMKIPDICIGFSAGAATLWRYAALECSENIGKVIAFYGGQIRHFDSLQPTVPVELVFPANEQHFDVSALITLLAQRKNTTIEHCQYGHGFMNSLSDNYDHQGYLHYVDWCKAQSR